MSYFCILTAQFTRHGNTQAHTLECTIEPEDEQPKAYQDIYHRLKHEFRAQFMLDADAQLTVLFVDIVESDE